MDEVTLERDGLKPKKLAWLDISQWTTSRFQSASGDQGTLPLNQAGLFSGECGTGKSIIELTRDMVRIAGKDRIGSLPEPGPAFYIGARKSIRTDSTFTLLPSPPNTAPPSRS